MPQLLQRLTAALHAWQTDTASKQSSMCCMYYTIDIVTLALLIVTHMYTHTHTRTRTPRAGLINMTHDHTLMPFHMCTWARQVQLSKNDWANTQLGTHHHRSWLNPVPAVRAQYYLQLDACTNCIWASVTQMPIIRWTCMCIAIHCIAHLRVCMPCT